MKYSIDVLIERIAKSFLTAEEIDDLDAMIYGLKVILHKLPYYLITFILSLINGFIIESFIFLFTWIDIRKYSGGFHFRKYKNCLASYILFYFLFLYCLQINIFYNQLLLYLSPFLGFIIYCKSPVTYIRNFTINERKYLKKMVLFKNIFYCSLAFLFYFMQMYLISFSIVYSISISFILIIIT